MKSKIKRDWIRALESGNYSQARGELKVPGFMKTKAKYCCLGILCNIYAKETGKGYWDVDGNFICSSTTNSDDKDVLPIEVKNWAGLNRQDPKVPFAGAYNHLSAINDGEMGARGIGAQSFKQIAALIKKHIPG